MLILNFMIFVIPWCQIVISHLLKKKKKKVQCLDTSLQNI